MTDDDACFDACADCDAGPPPDGALPVPPGAFDVGDWECCEGAGDGWHRIFTLREWRLSGRAYPDVGVVGTQCADGLVVRDMFVEQRDAMNPADARAVAAALIEAADFMAAKVAVMPAAQPDHGDGGDGDEHHRGDGMTADEMRSIFVNPQAFLLQITRAVVAGDTDSQNVLFEQVDAGRQWQGVALIGIAELAQELREHRGEVGALMWLQTRLVRGLDAPESDGQAPH